MNELGFPTLVAGIDTYNGYYSLAVFQEENYVPEDCGLYGGDSRRQGKGQLHLQQSDQEGNCHVGAQLHSRSSPVNDCVGVLEVIQECSWLVF